MVAAGTSAAVFGAWLFPIVDELVHSPGNVTLLRDSWEANTDVGAGSGYAARFLIEAIGATPLFARQAASIAGIAPPWPQMSSLRIVSALAILVALVGGTVIAVRRRDRIAAAAGGLAIVSVVTIGFVVARLTLDFGGVPRYRLLQGWIVGCFVWFATGFVIARAIAPSIPTIDAHRRRVVGLIGVATAVCALLAVVVAIGNAGFGRARRPSPLRAVDRLSDAHRTPPDPRRSLSRRAQHRTGDRQRGHVLRHHPRIDAARLRRTRRGRRPISRSSSRRARRIAAPWCSSSDRTHQLRRSPERVASQTSRSQRPRTSGRAGRSGDDLRAYLRDEARLTDKGRHALVSPLAAGDETASALVALHARSVDPIVLVDNGQIDALVLAGYLDTEVPSSEAYRSYVEARYVTQDLVYAAYLVP